MSSVADSEIVENPELDKVVGWRFDELLRAGWEKDLAKPIAENLSVDLHLACTLVQQGCSSEIAASILL